MNRVVMNRFDIVDHRGVDESLCASNALGGFGGHTFEGEYVVQPNSEEGWVCTILYCKRCGHVRELVVSDFDAG